jgi:hypothetical protein
VDNKMKKSKFLLGASTLLAITACGGGEKSVVAASVQTGVFLDSPIINIGYKTETLEGVTDSLGQYKYLEGETVIFSIGDLVFPVVTAKDLVTPLDIVDTNDTSDSKVVNMIRFLQTLDVDGDASNGLTISDLAKNAATQVNFDLTETDFEISTAVTSLILNAGQSTPPSALVSKADAIAHFDQSLIGGFSNLSGRKVSSVVTRWDCPSKQGGWVYSFSDTAVTGTGSDTWWEGSCYLEDSTTETHDVVVGNWYSCTDYPVCKISDFVKAKFEGIDQDDRAFTATSAFDVASKKLTYTKTVGGHTYTSVITIK